MFKSKKKELEFSCAENRRGLAAIEDALSHLSKSSDKNKEESRLLFEEINKRLEAIEDRQAIKDHDYEKSQKNKEFMRQVFIQAVPWLLVASGVLFQIGSKLYHTPSPEQKYYAELSDKLQDDA